MEKKEAKVSLSTFLLIFAIVIIAIMGYYIYKIGQDRNAQVQKVAELEKTVSTISSKAEEIQNAVSSATSMATNTAETTSSTGKKYEFNAITLTVPQEMIDYGKYSIKENASSDYIDSITFYSQGGGRGLLFSIAVQDKSFKEPIDFWETVKENDKNRVIVGNPTGVEWDLDSADIKKRQESEETWKFLQKFEKQIINSIEFK